MMRSSKHKNQDNVGSSLLSLQENQQVGDLLGRRCVSLCTTIVQLYMALPHSPSSWNLQHAGVLCFVKDNPQRSYFIRLYDIKASKMIWEQEVYNPMSYHRARPFFHTFTADDCQVGLNFASEQEAEIFFSVVDEKINQRNYRLEKRHAKDHASRDHDILPSIPPNGSGGPQFPLGNIVNQAPPPKSKKDKKEKEKKNKKKGGKLSKALIGAPSGFTHVSHVGMDSNNVDPDLMKLLSRAGISEADLRDTETSKMVRDIIERSGGIEAVRKEINQQDRSLPPLPEARHGALPPLPCSASPQSRLGPLPPPPGGCLPTESTRASPVRGLPPPPTGGRTGPLPPPPAAAGLAPSTQGGRRGPSPQYPASAATPSYTPARSGSLPAVPGGAPTPSPDVRGRTLPAPPSRSASKPGFQRRASEPPPPPVVGRRETLPSVPRGHSGLPPPPPGRTESLATPQSYEEEFLPPPPASDSFLPPPPSNFLPPPGSEDLAPPPPSFLPPPPNHQYSSDKILPPPPISANVNKGGPPPPPPPPPQADPPPSFGSAQPPPPSGAPPPSVSSGGGGGRGALLDQIRSGMKLKTVTASSEPPPSAAEDTGEGIVGALMMAMQKRSKVIQSSDEGDEFDDEEEDDDEWD
ncbi:uncharacterized protein wasa [Brachyhypopomus gauderio]|uniref:uncharacterized protein wasa n=1 Tax=Brachyhypopomus gauderio TaxID=698409 RepID=UPI0040415458